MFKSVLTDTDLVKESLLNLYQTTISSLAFPGGLMMNGDQLYKAASTITRCRAALVSIGESDPGYPKDSWVVSNLKRAKRGDYRYSKVGSWNPNE